ncbi:bifunctional [glutamate--ammonia ligase]-adenylyl-L-tyrosine phosphorylase/[glutamate--ammonia-ligase] adenylyltransferase [Lysobacteraceae bacterium NML95-0200]|nr:bifunctional [glutamate--ammonia ligase]-adenylyl-L-tyrosine phosphorylase/[glutamate--ammonia-ligase] adenylyltransferase [Xanthomonadaceae bacterium NML95-0200]
MMRSMNAQHLLTALAERAQTRLGCDDARIADIARISDFAIDTLARQPQLLAQLLADDGAQRIGAPQLVAENRSDWSLLLRRYRAAESTRLIWRDALGLASVEAVLHDATVLAETCLQLALAALESEFIARHGVVRDAQGNAVRLVVFGLGKLGGGELNFSSDIDLVYGYAEEGESDGARSLPAETYFMRLGQQLAKLLDEVSAEGFCHRVDLRLRPYGNAGRLAWSFNALEQYFQREGRDWERYAWQKARPVAGDIGAGEAFLQQIKPFIYRRYLDFGALQGLREMKALIRADVARKDRADDIKRGTGGIREIEFLVQALQLIRAGRETALQCRGLLPSLAALIDAGQIRRDTGKRLRQHYLELRRVENRLQMLRDAQTHELPQQADEQTRLAVGLGFENWPEFLAGLNRLRAEVSAEFDALLAERKKQPQPDALKNYWQCLPDTGDAAALAAAGFAEAEELDARLRDLLRGAAARQSSDIGRARLDRVMPMLIAACAASSQPDAALRRVLSLVQNILRRSSYLVLLDEQPQALKRLVDALSRSALLGERLAQYPLLLDELLDSRTAEPLPNAAGMHKACQRAVHEVGDDIESALRRLNETRQAISFRIALATLDNRQSASQSARQLAWLADAVVAQVLEMTRKELEQAHGQVPGAQFAVVGYGSLGGCELGFGSDLDLVFLFDAAPDAESDGRRPLDAQRWFARLAQKIVGYLQTATAAGRLFDVDVRLRPDGSKAMLVSSLESFARYQHERAWTWEKQALVRARCVAGDAALREKFDAIRAEVLGAARDAQTLRQEVMQMREKMRTELDRSHAAQLDIKQGVGGLVDIEFLLQYLVLRHANTVPALVALRESAQLITALAECAVLPAEDARSLQQAHEVLLETGLRCTLDRRKRMAAHDERAAMAAATDVAGLWNQVLAE